MSWPFQFSNPQNLQYLNSVNDFSNHLYFNGFYQNQLLQTISNSIFNSPGNCTIFRHPINSNQPNNFGGFQSFQKFDNNDFKIEQKLEEIQNTQKQQDLSEENCEGENNSEFSQKEIIDSHRPKTGKKQRNLISHNCSLRNDTKNIPKNYGKAMLSYIQKNSRQVKQTLLKYQVDFLQFMIFVKSFKLKINTIHDLRQMWGQNQKDNKFMKCVRILSYYFMRKKCLSYIFNSRIKNFHTHIKYKKNIMEGLQNPQNFTKIKQF